MNILIIFLWVWAAFIAMGVWESSVEGRNAWDKHKLGWKLKIKNTVILTKYHFYLFHVMIPLLMSLPLIIYGWDVKLFGILLSAYFTGLMIEDFSWYIFNPVVKMKEFGPRYGKYYPWITIGKFQMPLYYLISTILAILSWAIFWR
jgi:hypothetical protein